MAEGTSIPRQFVLMTQNGLIVIDWGKNVYQDVMSGEAVILKNDLQAYPIKEPELIWLKNNGTISEYDLHSVYFYNLPDIIKRD